MAYPHTLLFPLRSAAPLLQFLLYSILQRIGLHMQADRMVRWFGSIQQLIIDILDKIADGRAGKSENPGILKPRKWRGAWRQRSTWPERSP